MCDDDTYGSLEVYTLCDDDKLGGLHAHTVCAMMISLKVKKFTRCV